MILFGICHGKRVAKIESHGFDNKTIMVGKHDGRFKIYNKKNESDLNITGEYTRIELSREIEDFPIKSIAGFKYDDIFPDVYLNQYVYSLSDYEDKTLLALLYAIQSGYPMRDLTKTYRKKIRNLLEGGYKIKFTKKYVNNVIRQTIFFYFINTKQHFL